MNAPSKPGGLPPWFDPEMQQHVEWRDKDILISVPVKSGTTWTMNIVYQLLTGGDPDFEDIYAEVPWLEILTRPGMPLQELLDRSTPWAIAFGSRAGAGQNRGDVWLVRQSGYTPLHHSRLCRALQQAGADN